MLASIISMALDDLKESHPEIAESILSATLVSGMAKINYKSGQQKQFMVEFARKGRSAKVAFLHATLVKIGPL